MPGVTRGQIDTFVATIAATIPKPQPATGRTARKVVRQRAAIDRTAVG
jgi:hypothetical protein